MYNVIYTHNNNINGTHTFIYIHIQELIGQRLGCSII